MQTTETTYRCKQSFESSSGRRFDAYETITREEYEQLEVIDRNKFIEV